MAAAEGRVGGCSRRVRFDISEIGDIAGLEKFTKGELEDITSKYTRFLGKGRFAKVYLGTLKDGRHVAVKVPNRGLDHKQMKAFVTEIETQSDITNKNVVKLLGCGTNGVAPVLVYEHVRNGNLSEFLHGKEKKDLPLDRRLKIALETAEGLSFLHSVIRSDEIMHGDIRSVNILLDEKLEPKIADFGLHKVLSSDFSEYAMHAAGSFPWIPCNMNPKLLEDGLLAQKIDVYSFGVVLLELITRKPPEWRGRLLAKQFRSDYANASNEGGLYDADISSTEEEKGILAEVAALSIECLKEDVNQRPDMENVVSRLETIVQAKKHSPTSETPQGGDLGRQPSEVVAVENDETEDENAFALGKDKQEILGKTIKYGFCLIKGKVNHPMEDRHVVEYRQNLGLGFFAIFDGHGGHLVAEFLQVELLKTILSEPNFFGETEKSIKNAYEKVDDTILEKEDELGTAGSTAVTAFIIGDKNKVTRLVVANVGDSRAVICKNGKAEALSVDHEPKSERQMIEEKGGFVSHIPGDVARVDGQLAVSRAFGDLYLKDHLSVEPYVVEQIIDEQTDFLILASDGLWKVMKNQAAVDAIKEIDDAEAAAKKLIEEALTRNSRDDIACIVVYFK